MASTDKRYPLSAPDGSSIPFDLGYPSGLVIISVAVAASAALELPVDANLATFFSSCDCVVSFGDASPSAVLTEGVFSSLHIHIPANSSVALQIPAQFISVISADGVTEGKLYISVFEPWEGLGKDLLGRFM